MRYLGKLLGFIAGWVLAGPFGGLFGLIIGQYFDLSAAGHWNQPQRRYHNSGQGFGGEQSRKAFLHATFLVMGHIAKADGRVSENEIQAARMIMRSMMLSPQLKREAMALFTQGKSGTFHLQETINLLIRACNGQPQAMRMFVELQIQAAAADGMIAGPKVAIIEELCRRLGFNPLEFGIFAQHQQGYQQGYRQNYQGSGGYQRRGYNQATVEDPYKTLGVDKKASDAEIKKAYRRKISEHHPDKLVAKGLSEEKIKEANKKTGEIKKAYDSIALARGIK